MNDIEEEKAFTTSMKTMSLELILRNSLIKEEIFGGVSAKIRNAYNFRSAFSCLLWIFNYNLELKFHVYLYLFLTVLRLHDTMATINSNNIKFYQSFSTIKSINKNSMMTFQHKDEIARDTRDENADMWNLALIKMI
jgi:hypothetical protein